MASRSSNARILLEKFGLSPDEGAGLKALARYRRYEGIKIRRPNGTFAEAKGELSDRQRVAELDKLKKAAQAMRAALLRYSTEAAAHPPLHEVSLLFAHLENLEWEIACRRSVVGRRLPDTDAAGRPSGTHDKATEALLIAVRLHDATLDVPAIAAALLYEAEIENGSWPDLVKRMRQAHKKTKTPVAQ